MRLPLRNLLAGKNFLFGEEKFFEKNFRNKNLGNFLEKKFHKQILNGKKFQKKIFGKKGKNFLNKIFTEKNFWKKFGKKN